MWVQLRRPKQIRQKGAIHRYQPGDWVNVGRQAAQRWIDAGEAIIPTRKIAELLPGDAGMVITNDNPMALQKVATFNDVLKVEMGQPELRWSRTFIWDAVTPVNLDLIPQGFHLLETWQVAVPLLDYDKLALHLGDDEDRERTRAVVHDLRIPVYASGCVWARRCPATEELMSLWKAEPGDKNLGFLRALYQSRPLVLALPTLWASRA